MKCTKTFVATLLVSMTTLSGGAALDLSAAGSAAAATAVCNKFCDARDPGLSGQDRQPVTVTLQSRSITLHFDDTDAMGWASITKGAAGDEVWLDRSMDGGRTWASGSKLGDTSVPAKQHRLAHADVQRRRLEHAGRWCPAGLRAGGREHRLYGLGTDDLEHAATGGRPRPPP